MPNNYSGSFEDQDIVTIYQSTTGGTRTVKTTKTENETMEEFKARHIADIEDEMELWPPKFQDN